MHPGRSADLLLGDKLVGSFGELHPKIAKSFDVTGRAVLVAEFDLDAILAAIPSRFAYRLCHVSPPPCAT